MDSVDQDQTAQNVQSDLDLHCPQKLFVLSTVVNELMICQIAPMTGYCV